MPVRWTPDMDQLLLVKILETHDFKVDTHKVAAAWPSNKGEVPTARAIQERFVKIRSVAGAKFGISSSQSKSSNGKSGTPKSATSTPRKKTQRDSTSTSTEMDDDEDESPSKRQRTTSVAVKHESVESDIPPLPVTATPRKAFKIPQPATPAGTASIANGNRVNGHAQSATPASTASIATPARMSQSMSFTPTEAATPTPTPTPISSFGTGSTTGVGGQSQSQRLSQNYSQSQSQIQSQSSFVGTPMRQPDFGFNGSATGPGSFGVNQSFNNALPGSQLSNIIDLEAPPSKAVSFAATNVSSGRFGTGSFGQARSFGGYDDVEAI